MKNIKRRTKELLLRKTPGVVCAVASLVVADAISSGAAIRGVPAPGPAQKGNAATWKAITLTGRVTTDVDGSRFVVRPANRYSYQVLAVWGEPESLSEGDYVRAYGMWHNGLLHAENIRILREASRTKPARGYYTPNRTQTGVVVAKVADSEFMLRARNGYTALVRASRPVTQNLTPGDRVRVYGDWRNQILHASNTRVLGHGRPTGNSEYFVPNRTLTGVVTEVPALNLLPLRTANGRLYWVNTKSVQTPFLDVGDRVRVHGDWRYLMLHAKNIRVLRRSLGVEVTGNAYPDRVLSGVVTSNTNNASDRLFTLRAANGYTYPVRPLAVAPATLSAGDRVSVIGTWYDGMLHATYMHLLGEGRPARVYQEHVVTGVVTNNLNNDHFMLRADDGSTRRVLAIWGEPVGLRTGVQVRAYGDWRKGMLFASNVRVLR